LRQAVVGGQPLLKLARWEEAHGAFVVGSVKQTGEGFVLVRVELVWRWANVETESIGQVCRERS
jgi:hypothetical protein